MGHTVIVMSPVIALGVIDMTAYVHEYRVELRGSFYTNIFDFEDAFKQFIDFESDDKIREKLLAQADNMGELLSSVYHEATTKVDDSDLS